MKYSTEDGSTKKEARGYKSSHRPYKNKIKGRKERKELLQQCLLWLRTLLLICSSSSITSGRGSVLLFDLPRSAFATQWSCLKGYLPLSLDVKSNVCVHACVCTCFLLQLSSLTQWYCSTQMQQLAIMDSEQVLAPCKHLHSVEQVRLRILSSPVVRKMNVTVPSSVPPPDSSRIQIQSKIHLIQV